ncbi:MAG: hypothetical protein Q9227_001299 [Pyrenula ochraceoflavens]
MTSKVALVTASSAGVGAAIAKALAPEFRLVINYLSRPEKAQSVIRDCESLSKNPATPDNPRFISLQANVSQRSEIQRLVVETMEKMGRLDVVISNQGWTRMTNYMDLDDNLVESDWDTCFQVNVKSHLWLLHAARPHLEANEQGGAFVTTASTAGVRPSGSSLAYSVTKAAQIHLMRGLATICGPKIRVNAVSPGLMMTEWGQQFSEEKVKAVVANSKLKRLATPEDVAEQVRLLCLNKSMTGQNVVLDGGSAI